MKKLLTFVSAITAGAIGTAAAEVSVSGSGNFYYSTASGDTVEATQEDSMSVTGGSVAWSMSTETTNGITVSAGATISRDTDDVAEYSSTAAASTAVTGMSALTFGLVITLFAIFGKVVGCGVPAYFSGFNFLGSMRIAFGDRDRGNSSGLPGKRVKSVKKTGRGMPQGEPNRCGGVP